MAGRPAQTSGVTSLRVEVLKELQQLIESREARDRVDRGPLAETKGREHWVLHLILRALESEQSHVDSLVGVAYSNLQSRLQAVEDRIGRLEEIQTAWEDDFRTRLGGVENLVGERIDRGVEKGVGQLNTAMESGLTESLDKKWKPVGESIETFAQGSRQVLKDVADTYRVATQTRLLLNENARRITDLGRDIVALEESLKLVVSKTIEESLVPLEARVAALEGHPVIPAVANGPTSARTPEEKSSAPASDV
jgi:hypothetical protein